MKRAIAGILALLGMLLLTSCTGARQINELAIVTAVGLSVGDKPGTVKVSVQIVRPADARGQTGAPSGGTGEPIYSLSAEGKTIFDAIRNLGRISSRRVYWAHNFLIVMQEQYAKRGITDMVDFFTRNHELRMNTWVAVTPDEPDVLISTVTGIEVVPGEAVDKLFRDNKIVGLSINSDMRNLEESFLSRSVQPVLAKIKLVQRGISNKKPEQHGSINQVELAGAAAFHDDKLAGWLSVEEARGMLFFLGELQSGIEVIDCPTNDEKMTIEFHNASLKVSPSYKNEQIRFNIRLTASADIVESGCSAQLDDEMLKELESRLQRQLKSKIDSVLDKAQRQYHSDFLKLGDVFRNKYPAEWRALEKGWDEAFSEAATTVQVQAKIKSTVLKAAKGDIK